MSQTKAAGYIDQLNRARCQGDWQSVPELVRKVRKHASDRECLALTAESECAISTITTSTPSQPGAATNASGSAASSLDVAGRIPKLLAAIDNEIHHPEEKFQAQVCLGWLHWVVAEYNLALTRLPKSLDSQEASIDPAEAISEWTSVCVLKSAYLRANCHTRNAERVEALAAYQPGLTPLARVWADTAASKQLRYWAELFLTEFCLLASQTIKDNETSLEDANSLACFRSWGKFWSTLASTPVGGYGFKGSVSRRRVWNEYYVAMSRLLEEDLPYPTGFLNNIPTGMSARGQLRAELKSVESRYQVLLLSETTFPRADEERSEVEAFAKLLVKNWSILCGRGWREQDLGQGGRSGLSRGVLESLYGAATKTYHSTAILRSLFSVHFAVAEFDLAFKAFDSYMEIVKKGKARVEKTGHLEPSLDDDGTVLETMSKCVVALCQYGHRHAAERARTLGAELEDWLAKLPQIKHTDNGTPLIAETEEKSELHPVVQPHVVAQAWQAIGLSHALWSRVTSEAASRTEIQSRAIRCLRRSLASEFGRSKDTRGFFALALLLAERRELTAAIEVVRTALMASKGQEEDYNILYGPYWQERSLIPMWNLLALLLSARQDFASAARACEGALEQFKDPSVLFGKGNRAFKSEHLHEADAKNQEPETSRGLVDDMDDAEKESILEVKMTQLALIELIEGPEVAVNASYELLTLFSRLFGNISAQPILSAPKNLEPPKTSGTLRSIRGSIFGSKTDRSKPPSRQVSTATATSASLPIRPGTAQTSASGAPTIQVTGEAGHQDGQTLSRRRSSLTARRSESQRRNSLKKRERSVSRRRPSTASAMSNHGSANHGSVVVDGEAFFTPTTEVESSDFFSTKKQSTRVSSLGGRPLPSLSSYMSSISKFTEYAELEAESTYSSSSFLPLVQLPKEKEKMSRTTILIGIWLTIAGFYRRAEMFEDCKGAVAEAQKLVRGLEADTMNELTGSFGMSGVKWAEKKDVEGLWGDVWAELGLLSAAEGDPFKARAEFESALTHSPDHPAAIVGLSNILLDLYTEDIFPPPSVLPLEDVKTYPRQKSPSELLESNPSLPSRPLGLSPLLPTQPPDQTPEETPIAGDAQLPVPYKATTLPLSDRLAARDRAYALLTNLTRLGSGWNYSEAWFSLARAYELSGQQDKAKDVLWWCVELEEAKGVRDWRYIAGGGYIV